MTPLRVILELVSEPCSALCTSASQNLASVSGCHPLEEAVLLGSVDLLRLICSLDLHLRLRLLVRIYQACINMPQPVRNSCKSPFRACRAITTFCNKVLYNKLSGLVNTYFLFFIQNCLDFKRLFDSMQGSLTKIVSLHKPHLM